MGLRITELTISQILLLLGGAGFAGFVTGFAGFGTGLVASGFWFLAIPASDVPPLIVLISIVGQVIGLVRLRESFEWRAVTPYLIGGIIGLPVGIYALRGASPTILKMTVGAFLIAYASIQLSSLRKLSVGDWGGKIADAVIGSGGGFLGGFAGLSGPLPLVWLQMRGASSAKSRMTYQPFNLIVLSLAGIALFYTDQLSSIVLSSAVYCLPGTVIGTWIGLYFYSATGEQTFKNVILGLLMISGAILILQSSN